MSDEPRKTVRLTRTGLGEYEATNDRGGVIALGSGDSTDFTPVELLLVALAGCSAVDVDHMTSRRADPDSFEVVASGVRTDDSRLVDLDVRFRLVFPAGPEGDAARARIPAALRASHARDCTVSRTVEAGTPVRMVSEPA